MCRRVVLGSLVFVFLFVVLSGGCWGAGARRSAPRPATPETEGPPVKTKEEKKVGNEEESARFFGLHRFGVTNRRNAPPLSSVEKFHLFLTSTFSPVSIGIFAAQAGVTHAENEFPAYGQGMQGYGKRLGAALADGTSNGLFRIYVYPTLLKEDPRYFRLGEGSFGHRLVYGLEQALSVTRTRADAPLTFRIS